MLVCLSLVVIRCRSLATNRSLVLHASWMSVIGHRWPRGPMTNAQKCYNISANAWQNLKPVPNSGVNLTVTLRPLLSVCLSVALLAWSRRFTFYRAGRARSWSAHDVHSHRKPNHGWYVPLHGGHIADGQLGIMTCHMTVWSVRYDMIRFLLYVLYRVV